MAAKSSWQIEVFYDGDCPLCLREIKLLRWLDRHQRIRFTDIAAVDFVPAEFGMTMPEFMDQIQGRLPSGQWVVGMEVLRRLYAAIGLGPLVWLTRLPLLSQLCDFGYRVFAKNRLRLTGRCGKEECKTDSCAIDRQELSRRQ